jgi:hypothetical protein
MELKLSQEYVRALNVFNFPSDNNSNYSLHLKSIKTLIPYINNRKYSRFSPTKEKILSRCTELYTLFINDINIFNRNWLIPEVIDIVIQLDQTLGLQLLLRGEEKVNIQIERKPNKKVVYNDSQNVHNSSINSSVILACKELFRIYKHLLPKENIADRLNDIKKELCTVKSNDTACITETIDYIIDSSSTYLIEHEIISLQEIFICVYLFILNHKYKFDLYNRLIDEFYEMKNKCTTGYLSRLINSIQGYTDNPNIVIKISEVDRYKGIICNYLNKQLQNANESILNGIIDRSKEYREFIYDAVCDRLLDWIKEIDKKEITKIVNEYAGCPIFI